MASVSSLRVAFCWVCCCSRMSCWFSSYLAALERLLYTYVYIVVNSFPAFLCPLSRMLFGHLPFRWGVLFPSDKLLVYVVDIVVNSFPAFLCPLSRMLFGHLPSRWGVLFPSEKLLVYVVDVVVYPSRLLFVHFPEYVRAPIRNYP